MTWAERFDSFVGLFNPAAAYRRRKIRSLIARESRRDESRLSAWAAADSDVARGQRWITSRLSMDTDFGIDIDDMRAHVREAVKNDPYAVSYVESFITNTVGRPIRVQSRIKAVEGDAILTEESIKKWNAELEELWKRQANRLGVNGESWHELQTLAMRHWAVDGEIIAVLSDTTDDESKPLPLTLQIVDPARLETPPEKAGDKNVVLGVERNDAGRIVGYWFRKGVVGDALRDSHDHVLIAADRVLHVFDKWHADQTRGFPPLAVAVGRLKDVRDLHDAAIMNEQVSSCFGVVVKGNNPLAMADSRASTTLTDKDGNPVEEIKPGGITYTSGATSIDVLNPSRAGASVGQFTSTILHGVAAGTNSPFELIGKDYSGTTYSSGRLSLVDGNQNYERRQRAFIRGVGQPVWSVFVRQAVAFGETSIPSRDFKRRTWRYDRGQYMPSGKPWIDPVKDIQAKQMEIDAGLITYSDALAERGFDFDEVVEQRWKEKQKLQEFGLLPPDPSPGSPPPAPTPPSQSQMKALQLRIADLERRLDDAGVAA